MSSGKFPDGSRPLHGKLRVNYLAARPLRLVSVLVGPFGYWGPSSKQDVGAQGRDQERRHA